MGIEEKALGKELGLRAGFAVDRLLHGEVPAVAPGAVDDTVCPTAELLEQLDTRDGYGLPGHGRAPIALPRQPLRRKGVATAPLYSRNSQAIG